MVGGGAFRRRAGYCLRRERDRLGHAPGGDVCRDYIMDWPKGAHGNTYGGNPISSAAALATIDLIEKEFMQNAAVVGPYVMEALGEIQKKHSSVGNVRGKGLMIGIELVKNR